MVRRIVIADDHTIFRQGLAELFAEDPAVSVVGTAADGLEVLELARRLRPDVIVLDLAMPGLNGLQVARAIRDEQLPVRVVILTMHKDAVNVRLALEAGVDGYVLKDEAFDHLAETVRSVLRGKRAISPATIDVLSKGGEEGPLTPRESEVVALIAAGASTREIAEGLGVSVKTVETHRQHIMQKLGFHKVTEIVHYAVRKGLAR
jgi:DNA-binding NarL/FixJ family response regulator